MDPLTLSRIRALKNWWGLVWASRYELFKVSSIVFFGIFLLASLHWWFYRSMVYVTGIPAIGNLLMHKLMEIAFLSSFSLIALSAMVTSLSTHFGSSDLGLLLSLPVPSRRIYLQKAAEAMIHASWMVGLIMVPFLSVYARIKDAGFLFLAVSFILFLPFAFCASSLGIGAASVFVAAFPRRRLTELLSVLGILVFVLLYSGVRLTLPGRLIRPDEMEDVLQYILYLQSPAGPFLPSRWYVEALASMIAKDGIRLVKAVVILGAFAGAGYAMLAWLGTKVLTLRKWSRVLEGSGGEWSGQETGAQSVALAPAILPASLNRLFLLKEWKFFIRDSQRFSNVSFILAVCAIYLVSIYRLPMDTPQLKNFLSFINLALGLFIVAALSLRFCFPQPSLELQYSWIIRTSPVKPAHLLGSKFFFNFIFLNIIGTLIVSVSPFLLGTDWVLIPIYMAASFVCSTVFSALSLAVGSAFPKLRFENIIQIETSFGGFLYAVMTLVFVAITLAVFAWPIRYFFQVRYLNYSMQSFDWAWLGILATAILALSAGTCAFCWWSAKRSWQRIAI